MNSIHIYRNGEISSRVHFGTRVTEAAAFLCGKLFLIYDPSVEKYAVDLRQRANFVDSYALEASEENKTLASVEDICRWLLDKGADRDATLVALGGGIVTDMVGFAAGIYKRGVKAVYIPTTLLAQVDAAIGGKTGVNLDAYKNILGVFQQPEFTFICSEVLDSLPERVFRCGLAELLKTFIIENDGARVQRLLEVMPAINAAGGLGAASEGVKEEFGRLVAEAAGVKAGVVTRDERESGERKKLNLGHTYAHAIEYLSNSSLSTCRPASPQQALHEEIAHGEAVAMGMAMAAELSARLGICSNEVAAYVVEAIELCGLPTQCPYSLESLVDAMKKDKKAHDGKVHFILIAGIGDVVIRDLAPEMIKTI